MEKISNNLTGVHHLRRSSAVMVQGSIWDWQPASSKHTTAAFYLAFSQ